MSYRDSFQDSNTEITSEITFQLSSGILKAGANLPPFDSDNSLSVLKKIEFPKNYYK